MAINQSINLNHLEIENALYVWCVPIDCRLTAWYPLDPCINSLANSIALINQCHLVVSIEKKNTFILFFESNRKDKIEWSELSVLWMKYKLYSFCNLFCKRNTQFQLSDKLRIYEWRLQLNWPFISIWIPTEMLDWYSIQFNLSRRQMLHYEIAYMHACFVFSSSNEVK